MPSGPAVTDDSVSPLVRKMAAWAWRLLVLLGAVVAAVWVLAKLELIVVPVALATMLAALLLPAVDWLDRRGAPRGGAVALILLSSFAILGGILTFVVSQFIKGLPELTVQVTKSIDSLRHWLITGPPHLSSDQIDHAGDSLIEAMQNNQAKLTSGALSTAATVTEIITGPLLGFFTLLFFLHGGRNIWEFVTRMFPGDMRARVYDAGSAGFHSLIGYVRATFLVALVDAVGIGAGLAVMGVPLALPLASLVFLGAFIPLVGAVLTGFLAVVPGRSACYRCLFPEPPDPPAAQSCADGGVLGPIAGVVGALMAVPTIAFLNSAVRVLLADDPAAEEALLEQDAGLVLEAKADQLPGDGPATADAPGQV